MTARSLRLAFFTNTFLPDRNGVANCIATFRAELMRRGHEVYVFAPAPASGEDPVADDPAVIRFPSVPLFNMDYAAAMPFSRRASRTLQQVEFDLVHTHHPLWVGVWGALYARRHRLPLVATMHTHYELFARYVPLPQGLVKAYLRRRIRRYCNRCHLVTTPAPSNARRLVKLGVKVPVEVVPNPIDPAPFEAADGGAVRSQYGLEGCFVFGFVGRLSPEKRLDVVLKAAAKVFQAVPGARLMIVGDGPERGELKALARRLGIADRIVFTGGIEHSRIASFQAALDVFVTASIAETQPLAYAEAMACGVPVVAVAGLGAVDMITNGEDGVLVPRSKAVDALAEAIIKLAGDEKLRRHMGRRARETARRFYVGPATDKLLEVYERAIELAGRR